MTRVRYLLKNKMLVSKPLIAGHDTVVVTIDPESKTFLLTSYDSGAVVFKSEPHKTLPAVKIAVKTHLKTLGVIFDDEVRSHKDEQNTEETVG